MTIAFFRLKKKGKLDEEKIDYFGGPLSDYRTEDEKSYLPIFMPLISSLRIDFLVFSLVLMDSSTRCIF